MTSHAPIAIFIYARPDHLRRTLQDLKACDGFAQSPVFVFADGAKRPELQPQVDAARAVAREILRDQADYRFSERNKGLARSIIDGVDELTRTHGRAIVVEDDLKLSPLFLSYMNAALDRYAENANVYQVSGHMFDVPELRCSQDAVLLPFTTTWGWGTWQRAWQALDPAAHGWEKLKSDRDLRRRFNLDGSYDYATMLERQMRGSADSWGIRWYWSVFRRSGLTVFPPQSLVDNRGMDGSGSHGRGFMRNYRQPEANVGKLPTLPPPTLNASAFLAVKNALYRQNGGIIGKAVDRLKRLVR